MINDRPPNCPICNGEWIGDPNDITFFSCINYNKCRLSYIIMDDASFFVRKLMLDGTEVWWSSVGPCEIKQPQCQYRKINFIPPFDVDEARLKIFLVFS
jgi:hypothetical protein